MVTFQSTRCGHHNEDYAYTFHFNNQSASTTIYYCLQSTFAPQPNYSKPLEFQLQYGSMKMVAVPPGQTISTNFNTNGLLQAGQPPVLVALDKVVCARFWSGGFSFSDNVIGAAEDAYNAGKDLMEGWETLKLVEEEGVQAVFEVIQDVYDAGKEIAQACATINSDQDQYINLIVENQSGCGGWIGQQNNSGDEVATNTSSNGINMTVRIDGGGANNPSTQDIYFHYSDDAS